MQWHCCSGSLDVSAVWHDTSIGEIASLKIACTGYRWFNDWLVGVSHADVLSGIYCNDKYAFQHPVLIISECGGFVHEAMWPLVKLLWPLVYKFISESDNEWIWKIVKHLAKLWARVLFDSWWLVFWCHPVLWISILLMQMYGEPCAMCSVYKCTFIANKASCRICKQPLHDVVCNVSTTVLITDSFCGPYWGTAWV